MASSSTLTVMVEQAAEQLWGLAEYIVDHVRTRFQPGQPEFLMAILPIVGYWVVAGFYELLDRCPAPGVVRYRVTRANPGRPNSVTRLQVLVRVLLQQLLQTVLGWCFLMADPGHCARTPTQGPLQSAVQVAIAMVLMDTWQYWIHRWMHVSTFLYKHIHSTHHRLYITYAMGALYNHPLEALLLDTVGAGIAVAAAGMSCELSAYFFLFSTVKTVLDHCSYRFPLNPIHDLFPNSAAYHDVHHDVRGIKKNFSQPFFTWWDKVCGTYLDPAEFHLTQEQVDAKLGLSAKPRDAKPDQQEQQEQEEGRTHTQPQPPQKQEPQAEGGKEDGSSPAGSSAEQGSSNHASTRPTRGSPVKRASASAPVVAATMAAAAAAPATGGITTRSRARQQQHQQQ